MPNNLNKRAFIDAVLQNGKVKYVFLGPFSIGLFASKTFLLPSVNVRLRLIQSSPSSDMVDTAGLNSEVLILGLAFLLDRLHSQITD